MIRSLGPLAVALVIVAACGGGAPSSTAVPVAAADDDPAFDLSLAGSVAMPAYASDPMASLNECAPASSGGWSYTYAGGTPFLTVDLRVYSGVTSGRQRSDFDLDIVAPGGLAVRLVPSGRREGVQGAGTVLAEPHDDGGVHLVVDGEAVTLQGDPSSVGPTQVHLDLTCPADGS